MARFSIVDHTGDVGVDLEAATLEALFEVAGDAFADVICERGGLEPRVDERIDLAADAPDELLVAWLTELHYRFDVHNRLIARSTVRISGDEATGFRLVATAWFDPYDADRHVIKLLVKAITYHGLYVKKNGSWTARVIFDI